LKFKPVNSKELHSTTQKMDKNNQVEKFYYMCRTCFDDGMSEKECASFTEVHINTVKKYYKEFKQK